MPKPPKKADPKGTEEPCLLHAPPAGSPSRCVDKASVDMVARARAVEYADWFRREVETGVAQVDAGQTLTHEAVGTRLTKKFVDHGSWHGSATIGP